MSTKLKAGFNPKYLWRLLSLVLLFGAWELAGRKPISIAFPTFSDTAIAFFRMIVDGTLPAAFIVTLKPLAVGILIIGTSGILFGILMGLYRTFEWFTLPIFIIVQSAPMAALIPLITFLYGIGFVAKVLAVVLMAAPVIVLNSYKGIRNASPTLIQMSKSFLGSRRQQIFKIILPDASGLIFAGLRLGIASGFIGIILAELLITPTGIGDLITYYRALALYPNMFASIVAIVLFAAVVVSALQGLETLLFRRERLAAKKAPRR
ncbi:MAG: ABC transporter permease subunit [Spirochaetaceae bacterium]|nr:MAG: ABC transporter permease subunit [Spirochaetaceae bacterium]